jgi:hypothetical protein
MLGLDNQRAAVRTDQIQACLDGIGEVGFQGQHREGSIRLGEPDATAATVSRIETQGSGDGAAVGGEDERTEPGTDDAPDHGVRARGRGDTAGTPAAPFSAIVAEPGSQYV